MFESVANQHAPIERKRVREKDIPYMTGKNGKGL